MDPEGEGSRTFLEVYEHRAMAAARAADLRRGAGLSQGPLAGIPLSVKDAFDVAGSRTRAGSTVLADVRPAKQDSVAVARLRAAGAIIVGRTNMSEFAFTGLGLNPHYGSPRSPFERTRGRVAGGSSSGSAVSVCDGMALASIGTDTGGSGRNTAAFCGIVG
jgi:aspartyl-tRNA(Asn)/glutamyl-tRNA(Gln) amidotransferase subunit A